MKSVASIALVATFARASPVSKVVELLSNLEGKITEEKAAATKQFNEFSEWCEDQAKNLQYEIKTGKGEAEDLKASIEEETANAVAFTTKIDELSSSLAKDDADLKAATGIRKKESGDFAATEKELTEVIDMLGRASAVLQREMNKGGAAALLQGKSFASVTQAVNAIIEASVLSAADSSKLQSLLQSSQDSEDGSLELGAPAAAVYESHSGTIVDTVNDLKDKAQTQIGDARKAEATALHNFELLKQGLEDSIKFAAKDAAEAKKSLAASGEKKGCS